MRYWFHYPEFLNRTRLREMVDKGLSVREIGLRVGCSCQSAETALKKHGLTAKGQRGGMPGFVPGRRR